MTPSRSTVLPPLALQPYPTPPYFSDNNFNATQENDKASFEFTLSTTKDAIQAQKRQLAQIMDELNDERASLRSEEKSFNKGASDLTRQLEEERKALDEATRRREEVLVKKREVELAIVEVRNELAETAETLKLRQSRQSPSRIFVSSSASPLHPSSY